MTFTDYLSEKLLLFFLNAFCAVALCIYLTALGNDMFVCLPVLFVWAVILLLVWGRDYYRLKKKAQRVSHQLKELDQKYLIFEMLDKPENGTEKLCQDILRTASKSMLEKVNQYKNSQRRYKEYIEEWIHEIKTPITAIDLICRNHPGTEKKRIEKELFQINHLVEQALYYARSEHVEKDYFIKEFPLFDALSPVLLQNRTLLLEEKISLQIEETTDTVCTDEKWLSYILNQIISNSIKYHSPENPWIKVSALRGEKNISLVIEDNGQGILPEDLSRIFEKGFTGSARNNRKSTGMGLYLSRKLCRKLGLSIQTDSVRGEGTKITIVFPFGLYNHPERRE